MRQKKRAEKQKKGLSSSESSVFKELMDNFYPRGGGEMSVSIADEWLNPVILQGECFIVNP